MNPRKLQPRDKVFNFGLGDYEVVQELTTLCDGTIRIDFTSSDVAYIELDYEEDWIVSRNTPGVGEQIL